MGGADFLSGRTSQHQSWDANESDRRYSELQVLLGRFLIIQTPTMPVSGIIALLVAMIASRFLSERGYRTLSPEQKLRLMDGFSSTRMYSMGPLLVLIAAFWFLMTQTDVNRQVVTMTFFGLLIAYVITRTVMNQRKLHVLDMPAEYRRSFLIAQAVSLAGIAWFFYTAF